MKRVVLVLLVAASACSGAGIPSTPSTTTAANPTTGETSDTTSESEDDLEFATISLPDGLRPWWESANRTERFGDSNFLLAALSDVAIRGEDPEVMVLRLDDSLEWDTVDIAIPPSTTSADMFISGSRLVISYLDPAGEIVVASTEDGATFTETRLPLPERYVTANEWTHTSLIGNLSGVADLNGSVFAIANAGIIWSKPTDIAQEYAIKQYPTAAESIRYASTIRTSPTDDGDSLFVFEKSGEVVAEVLGSDAGIELGYSNAWRDRDDDTFESQSWMIDGTASTNLNTAPFNGEAGFQIHALYPVDGGVGALVTDLNFAERAAQASSPGEVYGDRGLATPSAVAIRTGESERRFRSLVTLDGLAWLLGAALGDPNPTFGSLAWATYGGVPLFILVFFADGEAEMAASTDGSTWSALDHVLNIDRGEGGEIQVEVTRPLTVDIYSSGDGSYQILTVAIQPSDGVVTDTVSQGLMSVHLASFEAAVRTSSATLSNIGYILLSPVPSNG